MGAEGTCHLEHENARKKLCELLDAIVEHGYGRVEIHISETRGPQLSTRILIWAGKSYVYIVPRALPDFKERDII